MNTQGLSKAQTADYTSCDIASLVDLRDIRIDTAKPVAERVKDFMEQVGNPYLFRVGDIVVRVHYGDGKQLSDSLAALLQDG